MNDERGRKRGLIGPWRLLDIARATMPMRASLFGMSGALPTYGPPDAPVPDIDPAHELPDSYIDEHERAQAVQRERARRFMAGRKLEAGGWKLEGERERHLPEGEG